MKHAVPLTTIEPEKSVRSLGQLRRFLTKYELGSIVALELPSDRPGVLTRTDELVWLTLPSTERELVSALVVETAPASHRKEV